MRYARRRLVHRPAQKTATRGRRTATRTPGRSKAPAPRKAPAPHKGG